MPASFYLSSQVDRKGDAMIRVSLYIRGVRFETSASCKIPPDKWDAARQRAKKGTSNAKGQTSTTINKHLSRIEEFCAAMESEYLGADERPTPEQLRKAFSATFSPKREEETQGGEYPSAAAIINDYVKRGCVQGWADNTAIKKYTILRKLNAWRDGVTLQELNTDRVAEFVEWMQSKGNVNSTINKDLATLRALMRWAKKQGYDVPSDYKEIRPYLGTIPREVVFLSVEELQRLYHYEIPPNGTRVQLTAADGEQYEKIVRNAELLQYAKDMFCFCCFTGLRYSDMQALRADKIKGDAIHVVTQKTGDLLTIPLNEPARTILAKYEQCTAICKGYAFPRTYNNTMNKRIREVCELCGLNSPLTQARMQGGKRVEDTRPKFEHIGTHAGRRTFICYALYHGVPAETIMKITGHKDYKAMRPYIAITDAAKRKAVDVFNNLSL